MQQTAYLVVNPITVNNFAALFNCTPVGRASDLIIIIISLFQEDNIFGTNASLTYGPRLQR